MSEIRHERKDELAANLAEVEERISLALSQSGRERQDVTLVVVTKTFPVEDAVLLYELGIRNFGENRDDEGAKKNPLLPSDSKWHFQGQVQGRKIASIASWADVVHSLDSLDHASKFASQPTAQSTEFFLQVNLEPQAEHRGGIRKEEIPGFLESSPVEIFGLMLVAPLSGLSGNTREAFSAVAALGQKYGLRGLSMGMSGDFEEALKAGATHIRVGSSILGSRGLPA
jgi:pyridoxal phosphate enzyme (YggS family)